MDNFEAQRRMIEEIVRVTPPLPEAGDLVTWGSVRRAFNRLARREDERDLERTQDELLLACDTIGRAYGKYVRLSAGTEQIDGTFRSNPYFYGSQFLYYREGCIGAIGYSPEDVVMKGMTRNGKRKVYIFEERYRESRYNPGPDGLDALVAKYHLWRAGVSGPDSVIASDRR